MKTQTNDVSETLFADERKNQILELVKANSKVTVAQLCDTFHVSASTVRNDLNELENSHLLKRTHGGAILRTQTGFEMNTKQKADQYKAEKQQIAKKAFGMIQVGDTILLDTGTTTYELSKLLTEEQNLTVVVNDIKIAEVLEDRNVNTVFIGGMLRKSFHCTIGNWAIDMLRSLCVDITFLGTNGLSAERGATTPDINYADVKKAMIEIADKVVILCDSSKIGRTAFVQFAPLKKLDVVVTDNKIDFSDRCKIEAMGVEIVTASSLEKSQGKE